MFVALFATIYNRVYNRVYYKPVTAKVKKLSELGGKWLWSIAIKFTRWQHRVTVRGARFDVPDSSIAGTKMIPFASYKAPQTQSRLPSPTK